LVYGVENSVLERIFSGGRDKQPVERRLNLENLESRWTPAWAGIPPTAITPPTNTVATTFNSVGDAAGSASISSGEVDYYSFISPTSGSFQLSASTPYSNLDPVLGLFNASGQRLAYNDDISSSNTDSRLTVNLTAGTRHYVGITNYSGSGGGSYSWKFDGPTPVSGDDTMENNDTFAGARNLGTISGEKTIGSLVMNDAADWYKFTTNGVGSSTNAVSIAFTHTNGDLDLQLYNSAGTRLATSEGTTGSERISLSNRPAGTYFVRVYGYNGAKNPQYSLTVNAPALTVGIDLVGASLTADDRGAFGQPISVQAAVRNNGTVASGSFSVEWWLSTDNAWSADDVILTDLAGVGNRSVASLAAGATSPTLDVTLSLPPSLPEGWSGSSFYLVMRTDAGDLVAEVNENNNAGQVGLGKDHESLTVTDDVAGQFEITLNISGMTASQRAVFQTAADRWAEVIVGDLPDITYNGVRIDDVQINARGAAIDGTGGILGQAGPDVVRSSSYLPVLGTMEFDTADLSQLEAEGSLLDVILHEMGHVLGIGSIWQDLGLLQGAGTSNPLFTGAQATAEYNRLFGLSAAGVPVENQGGAGTRDSHFRESVFGNELMTGYLSSGVNPLSRITVASMADLGYEVNMMAADSFARPGGSTSSSLTSSSTQPALVAGSSDHSSEQDRRMVAWEAALAQLFGEDARPARRQAAAHLAWA
jgi:hypothetical protein